MNYEKIYNNLVKRGKNRKLPQTTYTEVHHILPKSEGGSDRPNNLVELTAREHFLAHWLLYRMAPEISARAFSFWRMCNGRGKVTRENWIIPSSRVYAEGKSAWRDAIGEINKKPKSEEHLTKIANSNRGKKRTKAARKKMSEAAKKRGANSGFYKMIKSRDLQDRKQMKAVLKLDKVTGEILEEFESLKAASKSVSRNPSNLSVAIKKGTVSGDFRWRYKQTH